VVGSLLLARCQYEYYTIVTGQMQALTATPINHDTPTMTTDHDTSVLMSDY
jgi:hypothetical protein